MYWHPLIHIEINHDIFDSVGLVVNLILGITAIVSLWLSRKVFKETEFDSAMTTSPSIIIRPTSIYLFRRGNPFSGYGGIQSDEIVKSDKQIEFRFEIDFECFNVGRGPAFNVSKPEIIGMSLSTDSGEQKMPLYLTEEDGSSRLEVILEGGFDDFYKNADIEIPVSICLMYTNDQNNIFCRSSWKANIKPFDREGEDLKVRYIKVLKRNGKVEYSQKPYHS